MQDFITTYGAMADGELLTLYLERESLVPEARSALTMEMSRRRLTDADAAAYSAQVLDDAAPDAEKMRAAMRAAAADERSQAGPSGMGTLEVVFDSGIEAEATIVQGLLEASGFKVVVQRLGNIPGSFEFAFAGAKVLVPAPQAEEARRLIAESFNELAAADEDDLDESDTER